jgi:hypothetical protein
LGAGLPLVSFQHPNFVGSGNCALCHSLLTDAARNDVSIDTHWRSSMMANSGKDPPWQAKVMSEILRNPALKSVIENKCATCHMPMARTQATVLNSPVEIHGTGFLNPANGYHAAAMDGVSCALCHQIRGDGLGRSDSFSGHYQIDTTKSAPNRLIYGPFSNPAVTQMQNNIGFTPAQGTHLTARLLHQTVSYAFVADLLIDAPAAPEIAAFATLYNASSKTPVVITQLAFAADPAQLSNGTSNSDTRLLNLSSRARVGPGDVPAIAGFVLSGEVAKTVLIRAVGPTLNQTPFNLPGTLVDPSLTLYRGSTIIARNTGIVTSTNSAAIASAAQQVGAFALGSSGNDSALLMTLAPGAYTAVVASAANLTGVVLIEIYDVDAATAGPKLLNISTRAMAGAAENTLIAGIVLSGTTSKRMLFRAVGPGLIPFGVSGPLAQPTLTLYRGTQVLATNTNWTTSSDASAIPVASASVSAFTLSAGDSALLATLVPGS